MSAQGTLIVTEQAWLYAEADADGGVKLLVGKKPLAITVVILEEEILVIALENAIVEFDDSIVVEPPALAFDQRHGRAESLIARGERGAYLIDAAIVENILVFHTVDNGYPELAVHRDLRVNHDASAERYTVPRARGGAVAAV